MSAIARCFTGPDGLTVCWIVAMPL